jgi:hypothetical protein
LGTAHTNKHPYTHTNAPTQPPKFVTLGLVLDSNEGFTNIGYHTHTQTHPRSPLIVRSTWFSSRQQRRIHKHWVPHTHTNTRTHTHTNTHTRTRTHVLLYLRVIPRRMMYPYRPNGVPSVFNPREVQRNINTNRRRAHKHEDIVVIVVEGFTNNAQTHPRSPLSSFHLV